MTVIDEASCEARRLKEIDERDFPAAEEKFNSAWKRLREWTEANPFLVCPPGFARMGPTPHDLAELETEVAKTMQQRNVLLAERGNLRRVIGIDR